MDPGQQLRAEKNTNVFQGKLDKWSGQHEHLVYGLVSDVWHDGLDPWSHTSHHHRLAEHQVKWKNFEEHVGTDRKILFYTIVFFNNLLSM